MFVLYILHRRVIISDCRGYGKPWGTRGKGMEGRCKGTIFVPFMYPYPYGGYIRVQEKPLTFGGYTYNPPIFGRVGVSPKKIIIT